MDTALIPFSIHEYGARSHRRGGVPNRVWNPQWDEVPAHGPVRVLVENHLPVTWEGARLLQGEEHRHANGANGTECVLG